MEHFCGGAILSYLALHDKSGRDAMCQSRFSRPSARIISGHFLRIDLPEPFGRSGMVKQPGAISFFSIWRLARVISFRGKPGSLTAFPSHDADRWHGLMA